jgi:hypothetical protein
VRCLPGHQHRLQAVWRPHQRHPRMGTSLSPLAAWEGAHLSQSVTWRRSPCFLPAGTSAARKWPACGWWVHGSNGRLTRPLVVAAYHVRSASLMRAPGRRCTFLLLVPTPPMCPAFKSVSKRHARALSLALLQIESQDQWVIDLRSTTPCQHTPAHHCARQSAISGVCTLQATCPTRLSGATTARRCWWRARASPTTTDPRLSQRHQPRLPLTQQAVWPSSGWGPIACMQPAMQAALPSTLDSSQPLQHGGPLGRIASQMHPA